MFDFLFAKFIIKDVTANTHFWIINEFWHHNTQQYRSTRCTSILGHLFPYFDAFILVSTDCFSVNIPLLHYLQEDFALRNPKAECFNYIMKEQVPIFQT